MNSVFKLIVAIGSIIALTACNSDYSSRINSNSNEVVYELIGYVVKSESGKMLVTSYNEEKSSDYEAIWVWSNLNIEIGNKVKIAFNGEIATSDPAYGEAKKIDIINESNEQVKVLNKVLNKYKGVEIPIFKSINLDNQEWNVVLFDAKLREKEIQFTIKE